MQIKTDLIQNIFDIKDEEGFNDLAIEVFKIQSAQNLVYKKYLEALKFDVTSVKHYSEIPFLPIEFFKSHALILDGLDSEITFSSSGTSGMSTSKHHVSDLSVYESSFTKAFEMFWGDVSDYCFLALLPSYLEREGSSLIYMADQLIRKSSHPNSGFFLNNLDELLAIINSDEMKQQKVLLLGVSYALLDLAEMNAVKHPNLIVMETGGMKGRRKEMVKEELYQVLKKGLNVDSIASEYGMTELLSQAYSKGEGVFSCPPWMKVLIRDANDPLSIADNGVSGGINIIDLANINSCSFLMTQDLGKKYDDESFEILGRFDASDIRGCNLLVQ